MTKRVNMGDVYDLLFTASRNGNIKIVKKIFKQYKYTDVNIMDEQGNTPLHIATISNNIIIVKYLISKGACIDIKNKNGKTPLYNAIEVNNFEIASFLLTHGATVDIKDINGMTPLHIAVINKLYNITTLLIFNHSNTDIKNSNGETPLDLAKDDKQMISILTGNLFELRN